MKLGVWRYGLGLIVVLGFLGREGVRAAPSGRIVGATPAQFVGGQTVNLTIVAENTSPDAQDLAVRFTVVPSGWKVATDVFYPFPGWDYLRTDGVASGATNEFQPFYVTPPAAGGSGVLTWELWQVSSFLGVTTFVQQLDQYQQPVAALGPPGTFGLLQPSSGSTAESPTPEFRWQAATNATTYRIEIEGDLFGEPNPLDVIRTADLGSSTHWVYQGQPALACDWKLWWRIWAVNPAGQTANNGGWQSFTVTSPDPFGLAADDVPGLLPQLQCLNRDTASLTDLAHTLTNGLASFSGVTLNATNTKVLVLIHGWNPSPALGPTRFDLFNEVPWKGVVDNLTNSPDLTSDWTLVTYNWAHDANVGTVPEASPESTQGPEFIPFIGSATDSAERAYQHGLMIGRKLLEQVGTNHLKQVELAGHSAGSWAVYSALRYLRAYGGSDLQIQVTYLDPFIPAQACLNSSHPFGPALLQSSTNFVKVTVSRAVAADGYWATYDDVTDYAACGATTIRWSWPLPNSVTFKVDETPFGQANWYAHDGPVNFYAATIANPLHPAAGGNGWIRSMMHNEHRVLTDDPPDLTARYDYSCGCIVLRLVGTPGDYELRSGDTLGNLVTEGTIIIPGSGEVEQAIPVATEVGSRFFQVGSRREQN